MTDPIVWVSSSALISRGSDSLETNLGQWFRLASNFKSHHLTISSFDCLEVASVQSFLVVCLSCSEETVSFGPTWSVWAFVQSRLTKARLRKELHDLLKLSRTKTLLYSDLLGSWFSFCELENKVATKSKQIRVFESCLLLIFATVVPAPTQTDCWF